MEAPLTRGAVAAIAASKMWDVAPAARRAVLQVVDVSWVAVPPVFLDGRRGRPLKQDGYVMVLSDGVHTLGQFRLSTPVEHYIRDGQIRKGTVLRLLNFCCNVFWTDRIYIYHFEVLQTECALIGSPTLYQRGLERGEQDAKSSDSHAAAIGGSCSSSKGMGASWPRRL